MKTVKCPVHGVQRAEDRSEQCEVCQYSRNNSRALGWLSKEGKCGEHQNDSAVQSVQNHRDG